ncbi:MAG: mandelate racemase/muconate lactonizing protein [Chloroflexi bacterium]|nr:mandelate racemase/muconate lactonizing protein [Chloroflexota bacterium]
MKITNLRLRRLHGMMDFKGTFWEERLVRPVDIYPDKQREGAHWLESAGKDRYRMSSIFVEIETDEGVAGIGGPITDVQAFIIARQIAPVIKGQDPTATEYLWDLMFRTLVHGRQSEPMMALSAIDCALWDTRGKWLNKPVHRLLGGPTRSEVPAYASMLGYSVRDLGLVKERALEYKRLGYGAQKWFFIHGPGSGAEGVRLNVALVKTLRETLGDDYDIMLDAWQSWDYQYAIRICQEIEEYKPRWLEEVAMPDRIDTYVQVKAATSIPLSGAEHEYTRWGFKRFIEAGALDILQPDIYWCGGMSETLKIAAYASVYDLSVIPHGHSTPAGIHFSAAMSPSVTWIQEFLVKWNVIHQWFLKNPIEPANGVIKVPEGPGMGMDLDPAKIEKEEELRW